MKKVPTHFHRYERMTWPNGRPFYKCMEPNCPHYLSTAELAIGRESLCWGVDSVGNPCDKLVTITREDILRKVKKPMCEDCRNTRLEQREALKGI
jgi:hypothetical protein